MTHISVGPFELDATLSGSDIKVSMSVGYHGISMHESFSLSLAHPSITWNSPTVADFSVSLSISYSDNDGTVSVRATETYPSISFHGITKHHKHQSVSVRVLPDHALAYIGVGLPSAGLDWMERHLPVSEIPTPGEVSTFLRVLTPESASALKALYACTSGPDKGHHLLDGLTAVLGAQASDPGSKAQFRAIAAIPQAKWIEILRRCVANPTVQAYFPGIAKGLHFPDATTMAGAGLAVDQPKDRHKTAEKIQSIAAEVLEGSGAALAAVVVLSGIVFSVLGVVAGVTAAPSAGGSLPAVGVVAIVAGVIFLAIALAVLAVAAVSGLVLMVVHGYLVIRDDAAVPPAGSAYPMLDRAAANPA